MEVVGRENYSLDVEELHISIRVDEKKDIPAHIALALEKNGIIDIPLVEEVTLKKMIMEEKRGPLPNKLPVDFFEMVKFSMEKGGTDDKKRAIRVLAGNLVKERVEKIFKLSVQGKTPKVDLLPEEKSLLIRASSMLTEYESEILGEK